MNYSWILLFLALAVSQASKLAHRTPGYLAICLLARDGNRDIREWVEYHLFAGVDHIYLLDHNSSKPMLEEVWDYVVDGGVQYTAFTSMPLRAPQIRYFAEGLQGRAYQQCFDWARDSFTWLAFIDLDEFLVVTEPKYNFSLPALLGRYESHGAVLAHWQRIGSGGLKERKEGQGRLETFTKCAPPNDHVKGIANLKYASIGHNPHVFVYANGRKAVRPGDGMLVGASHSLPSPTTSPLVVYHYNGAISEWRDRVNRLGGGVSGFTHKNHQIYEQADAASKLECRRGAEAAARMERRRRPGPSCAAGGGGGGSGGSGGGGGGGGGSSKK